MDRVYQNATLMIFAGGADNVDSGLSIARDPQETKPCQVNVKFTIEGQTSDITTLISFYRKHVHSGHYPLFDREWVLQEQVMSQRSLIFGSRFMSWESSCARSSEKWPTITTKVDDLPPDFSLETIDDNLDHYISNRQLIPKMRIVVNQEKNPHEAFNLWYEMVQEYSRRTLSYPSDVLPALSGLSNAVGRLYKSTYAFGIWLEHLHGGLTWYIRTPLESPKEPVQSGANYPSWTWMSRWGHEIRFREAIRFDCFEYQGIETRCGASSESTTESKTLLLSGCLKVAEARPLATEWNGESRGRALWFGSVFRVWRRGRADCL